MSTKYKFTDIEGLDFILSTVVDWVDVFTRNIIEIFSRTVSDSARRNKTGNTAAQLIATLIKQVY